MNKNNLTTVDDYIENTREFLIWSQIICRCRNKSHPEYYDYGGEGVTICDEWGSSFKEFLHDMGKMPVNDCVIERIDPTLPFNKDNCRWRYPLEQSQLLTRVIAAQSSNISNEYHSSSRPNIVVPVDSDLMQPLPSPIELQPTLTSSPTHHPSAKSKCPRCVIL